MSDRFTPEIIAATLTAAQKEGVIGERLGGAYRVTRCRRTLVKMGLCQPQTRCLTPLGLQVRDHLREGR
jgi:hypothetical protein